MFRIGDKTILKELKKSNIREKEFIKSIVDQKEDNQLIIFENDNELIVFDYNYNEYLKQKKNIKFKYYRPKKRHITKSFTENTIDTSFLDIGIENIN